MANKQLTSNGNTTSAFVKKVMSEISGIIRNACTLFSVLLIILCALSSWAEVVGLLSVNSVLSLLLFCHIAISSLQLGKIKKLPSVLCFVLQVIIFTFSFHLLFLSSASGAKALIGDTLVTAAYILVRAIIALISRKCAK